MTLSDSKRSDMGTRVIAPGREWWRAVLTSLLTEGLALESMVKIHRMSKKIDHSRHMACVTMGRALDEALLYAGTHIHDHDQGIGWCWCSSLVTNQPHGVCEWCRTMNMTHMSVIAPTAHGLPVVTHAICLLWSIFLLVRWILTIPKLVPQSAML